MKKGSIRYVVWSHHQKFTVTGLQVAPLELDWVEVVDDAEKVVPTAQAHNASVWCVRRVDLTDLSDLALDLSYAAVARLSATRSRPAHPRPKRKAA